MSQTTIPADLMREDECARRLDVSPKTLANQRSRGEGPPYIRLSGGAIRYSRRAIDAYIRECTVVPGARTA